MHRHPRLLIVLAFGTLGACARVSLPVVGPEDVDRASARWPGTSVDELARGRSLYAAHCVSCHRPVLPAQVPASEWPGHIMEMQERAGLTADEAELVTRYLVTMSSQRASR